MNENKNMNNNKSFLPESVFEPDDEFVRMLGKALGRIADECLYKRLSESMEKLFEDRKKKMMNNPYKLS